ncbi:MAG: glycine--tRNA ligase subunit beta [Gammaproteobacteria bacterium]|nr:glycine--tRNA ligase subunit beta [Gammaproteobacteria bacterium]
MASAKKKTPVKKTAKADKGESLLVEILTEELPPKALYRLMEAFSHGLFEGLREKGFLLPEAEPKPYATPRRLAVVVSSVIGKQADRLIERKGPAVASAFDVAGKPTPALLGFAKSCGVDVSKLDRQSGEKGEYFVARLDQKGEPLASHLPSVVEAVLKKLPMPKVMRWGAHDVQFVRPVHGVVLLHGSKVVPGTVLGLKSGNKTRGHRFLSKGPLTIAHVREYEKTLRAGRVLASFEARREVIAMGLDAAAHKLGKGVRWDLGKSAELAEEVTSIVEWPVVLTGGFDKSFLDVPKECLIISMQQHQKYFPLVDGNDRLLPQFLFVSNQQAPNPKQIIAGNERVLRARLSDARFFYDQDRKTKLETRVSRLANVVYHNKLGSQLERVERVQKMAGEIARRLQADVAATERAACLAKADLLTDMVGEFPELQGVMGRYYAHHDGESAIVSAAVEQHYWPRFAGDVLPASNEAAAVALADRLYSLAGMFGIGQQPTGDKDPFGLRRAALGLIRIVIEKDMPLKLNELINLAYSVFPGSIGQAHTALESFIFDRLAGYLREGGAETQEVDAVLSWRPVTLAEVPKVLKAVQVFQAMPEAAALAAANKRIVNILRKAGQEFANADAGKLVEPAERTLFEALQKVQPAVESCFKAHDYTGALQRLAALKQPVDAFFDSVMVMAEDSAVRDNRLALLGDLKALMNRVADISKLAV